ncbi:unnamed protein product [Didymodactylos carnosus]|uniref:U1 small nuclear ribonucleoprotein C n=1 Tax=Didymodactylos carnosus TaxID=1234261 RepID=A0A813V2T6_9BILA|nr:unnamed protein product [Didymodactylos carnosus]CAF1161153.1 unnamed protein product [Didymodactylos carnosus]CAF3617876.1 unnamed protein product [Didymodactylos carnosus]CAF3972986.1 unnamed protein product [Didymodactylos carnosus]
MPKYYCDYCDTYLTHDSPSVRKTHCQGRKHKENVRDYYQKWMEEQAQRLIDQTTAAFKSGKLQSNPFGSSGPGGISNPAMHANRALINAQTQPPRNGMPMMAMPPWGFQLPPGMRPLGPPPTMPLQMQMQMRPPMPPGMTFPPGIVPTQIPPPPQQAQQSTE